MTGTPGPARTFLDRDRLAGLTRTAFGRARRLTTVTRLTGGSKKGVYRLGFDDGFSAILYVWSAAENYWPSADGGPDPADPFSDASGIGLFTASRARLDALDVRTPDTYLADASQADLPADVALVEDVPGESLEALLDRGAPEAEAVLARLDGMLRRMHQHTDARVGRVTDVARGGAGRPCERIVLDRALDHLDQAAARVERIADARDRLTDLVRDLAAGIRPRSEHSLIHGELGPDHVRVDRHGQPVLIDIEGVMFFDVEWEHAFLRLRFRDHFRWLRRDGLDEQRMRFYDLAQSLSLVAGPLRLLDGDFPHRELMRDIVDTNISRTLAFLR